MKSLLLTPALRADTITPIFLAASTSSQLRTQWHAYVGRRSPGVADVCGSVSAGKPFQFNAIDAI
jgi:hypothetical protein